MRTASFCLTFSYTVQAEVNTKPQLIQFRCCFVEPPITATIGCYSTYHEKVAREGMVDLVIVCTATNTDSVDDLYVEYSFMNRDEKVILMDGEDVGGRLAKSVSA